MSKCSICGTDFNIDTEGGVEFTIGTFIDGAFCLVCESVVSEQYGAYEEIEELENELTANRENNEGLSTCNIDLLFENQRLKEALENIAEIGTTGEDAIDAIEIAQEAIKTEYNT